MRITRCILTLTALPLCGGLPAQAQQAADEAYTAALALAARKEWQTAAPALEKVLQAHPQHVQAPVARLALGEAYLSLKQPQNAQSHFSALLQSMPQDEYRILALLGLGKAQLALDQDEAARKNLEEVFRLTDQNAKHGPEATLYYGQVLLRLEQYAEAVQVLGRISRWPQHSLAPQARFQAGEAYRLNGQFSEAATTFRVVADTYWRDPLAHRAALLAGDCYLLIGQYADAEQEYRRVLKDYLDSASAPHAQLGLGRVAMAQGQTEVARAAFQAAALVFAKAGFTPTAELRIADTYAAEKKYTEAREIYTKLTEAKDPLVAGEARYLLARTHLSEGRAADAERIWSELASQPTAQRWSQLARVRLAEQRGRQQGKAEVQTLRDLLATKPEPAVRDEANLALGIVLLRQQQPKEALAALEPLTRRAPSTPLVRTALVYHAQARMLQGDAAAAQTGAETALKQPLTDDLRALALATLGQAQLTGKEEAKGIEALRGVVEQHPRTEAAVVAAEALLRHYRTAKQTKREAEVFALVQRLGINAPSAVPQVSRLLETAQQHLEAERYAEALPLFEQSLKLAEKAGERHKALAGAAVAAAGTKRVPDAERHLTALKESQAPAREVAAVAYRVGSLLERAGEKTAALAAYQTARTSNPAADLAPDVLLALSRLFTETNRHDDAEAALQEIAQKHAKSPAAPAALYALAWSHLERNTPDRARALFSQLVKEHGSHALAADAHFRLGELAYAEKDYEAAARHYRSASAGPASLADKALYKLGWTHRHRKEHVGAAEAFLAVVERAPNSPLALESRIRAGEAFLELEQDALAREQFQAALTAAKSNSASNRLAEGLAVQAQVGLALACLMQGDFVQARAVAEPVASPDKGWYGARAHLLRAEAVYLKDGAKVAVKEYVQGAEACAAFPDVAAELNFRAGECYQELGDHTAARAAWNRVMQQFPGTPWAERSKEKLATRSGPVRIQRRKK